MNARLPCTQDSSDSHAVRVAVAQIQGLVDGFVRDSSGEGFRQELDRVIAEAIDPYVHCGTDEIRRRVALLLYGAALVSAGGLALAAELGRETRTEVQAMVGQALDAWLDHPLAGP